MYARNLFDLPVWKEGFYHPVQINSFKAGSFHLFINFLGHVYIIVNAARNKHDQYGRISIIVHMGNNGRGHMRVWANCCCYSLTVLPSDRSLFFLSLFQISIRKIWPYTYSQSIPAKNRK